MEFTGRLTKDAVVATTAGKQVVNFGLADNDTYKPKGSDSYTKITTFFSCAYWQSVKVASVLRKGTIVTVKGRVGAKAYLSKLGEPKAELTFHVDGFKIVAFARKPETNIDKATPVATAQQEDDLPF